jgi:hypothetical protein
MSLKPDAPVKVKLVKNKEWVFQQPVLKDQFLLL